MMAFTKRLFGESPGVDLVTKPLIPLSSVLSKISSTTAPLTAIASKKDYIVAAATGDVTRFPLITDVSMDVTMTAARGNGMADVSLQPPETGATKAKMGQSQDCAMHCHAKHGFDDSEDVKDDSFHEVDTSDGDSSMAKLGGGGALPFLERTFSESIEKTTAVGNSKNCNDSNLTTRQNSSSLPLPLTTSSTSVFSSSGWTETLSISSISPGQSASAGLNPAADGSYARGRQPLARDVGVNGGGVVVSDAAAGARADDEREEAEGQSEEGMSPKAASPLYDAAQLELVFQHGVGCGVVRALFGRFSGMRQWSNSVIRSSSKVPGAEILLRDEHSAQTFLSWFCAKYPDRVPFVLDTCKEVLSARNQSPVAATTTTTTMSPANISRLSTTAASSTTSSPMDSPTTGTLARTSADMCSATARPPPAASMLSSLTVDMPAPDSHILKCVPTAETTTAFSFSSSSSSGPSRTSVRSPSAPLMITTRAPPHSTMNLVTGPIPAGATISGAPMAVYSTVAKPNPPETDTKFFPSAMSSQPLTVVCSTSNAALKSAPPPSHLAMAGARPLMISTPFPAGAIFSRVPPNFAGEQVLGGGVLPRAAALQMGPFGPVMLPPGTASPSGRMMFQIPGPPPQWRAGARPPPASIKLLPRPPLPPPHLLQVSNGTVGVGRGGVLHMAPGFRGPMPLAMRVEAVSMPRMSGCKAASSGPAIGCPPMAAPIAICGGLRMAVGLGGGRPPRPGFLPPPPPPPLHLFARSLSPTRAMKGLTAAERPRLVCTICHKTYASRGALREHIQTKHEGKTPYKCTYCSKTFGRKNYLTIHLRTHTGERPYQCQECGKSFTQKGALKRHSRLHTGEKPYACTIPGCGKTFSDSGNMRKHIKNHQKKIAQFGF